MTFSPYMRNVLIIGSGLCWTIVYLLIIKRGFQDKTYGMPMWALAANISWEFIFSALILTHGPLQHGIDVIWCLFDVVIAYQFLRFGRSSFRGTMLEPYFWPTVVLVLAVSFGAVYFMTVGLDGVLPPGNLDGRYAAFAQNLMMSILFVAMLVNRNTVAGQSVYIAIFKLIGTALPSLLFYSILPGDVFLTFLYVAIFVFDALYVLLLVAKCRALKISPWTRL